MEPTSTEPMKFQKLAPTRIFEQAAEQIQELISNGSLLAGQKLPTEQELCRQLNVSRSSVREALRLLEAEGYVEVKRGSGTFVSNGSPKKQKSEAIEWLAQREETLEQVLQVRESVEGLTASLTAAQASKKAIAKIREILEEQTRLISKPDASGEYDIDALARLDVEFHLMISSASGNDIANEIIVHLIPAFTESNKTILFVSKKVYKIIEEHRAIVEALEARDSAAAEKAMREHISEVRRVIMTIK